MKRVYIIASGPSLRGFDFNKLRGQDIIAMNGNISYVPRDSVVAYAFLDPFHLREQMDHLAGAPFPIYTAAGYSPIAKDYHRRLAITEIPMTGVNGIDFDGGIRHGFNTGYLSLHLAVNLGYKDIRVLGMDVSAKGHFYDPNFAYNFSYVHEHLRRFKEDLPEGILVTFYGKTSVKIFINEQLGNVLKPIDMATRKTKEKKVTPKHTASPGHVIVKVLKDYQGMTRPIKKGEIIEIPERQLKGRMMKKGYYELYDKGDKQPLSR